MGELHDIIATARSINALTSMRKPQYPSSLVSEPDHHLSPLLRIPVASNGLSPLQLEEIGMPPPLAQEMTNSYQKAIHGLRDKCEMSLRNAIRDASMKGKLEIQDVEAIQQVWNAVYTREVMLWSESAFTLARDLVAKAQAKSFKDNKKAQFNHVRDSLYLINGYINIVTGIHPPP
jgi:hypothetical protein